MYEKKYYRIAFGVQSLLLLGFGGYALFFAKTEQDIFVTLFGLQAILAGLPYVVADVHTKQRLKDVFGLEQTYALAFFLSSTVITIVWIYQAFSALFGGHYEGGADIFASLTSVAALIGQVMTMSLITLQNKKTNAER